MNLIALTTSSANSSFKENISSLPAFQIFQMDVYQIIIGPPSIFLFKQEVVKL